MATTRIRRVGGNPPAYAVDQDGDRVYTEEDYAAKEPLPDEWAATNAYDGWIHKNKLPDESFLPEEGLLSEAEQDAPSAWAPADFFDEDDAEYAPLFGEEADFAHDVDDADPLDHDLLTDEERAELRRSHWQLIAGLADFAGVILGTAAILILVTLLVSLLNWLVKDMSQSFILLQKNL